MQPANSSFVYFGHDTVWYPINDLPIISLNFYVRHWALGPIVRPCIPVGSEVNIYPNPSSGIFNFKTDDQILSIEIMDIQGKLIESRIEENSIDISNQPPGVYFANIVGKNKGILFQKLVKY